LGDSLFEVGKYVEKFNELTGQNLLTGPIYQASGLATHIKKHHPTIVSNIGYIPDIIAHPDYVGRNPKEPDSVELVKCITDNLMVCVKLDQNNGYFYVASLFDITDGKLANRLKSGRLKPYK